jgi:hypothetical protein
VRAASRPNLADKLTVEAKVLGDLEIEKAAVEGERRSVERPISGPSDILPPCSAKPTRWCCVGSSWPSRSCSIRPQCSC